MSQCGRDKSAKKKTHYESRFNFLRISLAGAFQLIKVSSISPLLCLREDDMTTVCAHKAYRSPFAILYLRENKLITKLRPSFIEMISL